MFNKILYNFKIVMFNEKVIKFVIYFFVVNGIGELLCFL